MPYVSFCVLGGDSVCFRESNVETRLPFPQGGAGDRCVSYGT